jgi:hypothetical protein
VSSPRSRWFPAGDDLTLTIFGGATSILIRARVAWSRKTGWRTGEMGLMFLDLSPEARAWLASLAVAASAQAGQSRLSGRAAA